VRFKPLSHLSTHLPAACREQNESLFISRPCPEGKLIQRAPNPAIKKLVFQNSAEKKLTPPPIQRMSQTNV
jgi:hypothetical protein